MNKIIELGNITFSERVVISDPCYERDVWCMDDNVTVKPGEYRAYAVEKDEKQFGIRIASLICIHRLEFENLEAALAKKWCHFGNIGVDSGQAGIFDNFIYPMDKESESGAFFDECCDITVNKPFCASLPSKKGVVCSSGYGDGSYSVKALYENDCCIALMIDFGLTSKRKIMEALLRQTK